MQEYNNYDLPEWHEQDYQEFEQVMPKCNEDLIIEDIQKIEQLKKDIKDMQAKKEELEQNIKKILEHEKEGSTTYTVRDYKVKVTTDNIYSVDKKKYESIKYKLNPSINPVRESVKYTVSARDYQKAIDNSSEQDKKYLCDFLAIKAAKLSVSFKKEDNK